MTWHRRMILALLAIAPVGAASGADVFRFYAPPGGVYANASLEREAVVEVEIAIEHEGTEVAQWFVTVSRGASSVYEPRTMAFGSHTLAYQVYGEHPPAGSVIKEPPDALTWDNVVTSGAFGAPASTPQVSFVSFFVHIPAGQFVAAGEYTDSVTLSLYTGDPAEPATHALADSVAVAITGRMARILDLYAVREPGIRTMDLTTTATDRLIATVNERSNSATGYTVLLTSRNLAADLSGEPTPFFLHSAGAARLSYVLTYAGVAVSGWSGGSAVLTDSDGITAPGWASRELRIGFTGSATLSAGSYEDILTITIRAK